MEFQRASIEPALKYDAFWHLQAIGLMPVPANPMLPSEERGESKLWDDLSGTSAVVAIIDTGVSDHPYLNGRLDPAYNIDLTGEPTLDLPDAKAASGVFAGVTATLSTIQLPAGTPKAVKDALDTLVAKYEKKRPYDFGAPSDTNQKFAAHGTSCAGLVAASSKNAPGSNLPVPPYYRGVDPGSKVMSITTSFAPHPELLTLAFLLAAKKPADVILFPRGLPREVTFTTKDFADEGRTKEEPSWQALKETIIAVSKKIPIICAAGNESDDRAIAPAVFAKSDNGIIGVAAMNYYGVRSSYSNFGNGVTITAPSDDAEIFNADQARIDKTDRFCAEYPYPAFVENFQVNDIRYGEAVIRAIDVPGSFGFSDASGSADPRNDEAKLATEPESFFTEFGGTSAAASIVAGAAALMQRVHRKKHGSALGGVKIRELMTETARKIHEPLPHLPSINLTGSGVNAATGQAIPDKVNGQPLTFQHSFGSGLIAVDRAVAKILSLP
jgi:subtilisin family serine protease